MQDPHLTIIGGGLAGLAAGCYARANGIRTTIFEHNLALGGVCTAWTRSPYVIDGCIHWLTGGPFERLYRELAILPAVQLETLTHFATYQHAESGSRVAFTRDLDALATQLQMMAPEDTAEIATLVETARRIPELEPALDRPHELMTVSDAIRSLWSARHVVFDVVRFRSSLGVYLDAHIRSHALRRVFGSLFPLDGPALFLPMLLGYLERGFLSRPIGGTAAFRDALIQDYRALGGEVELNATVDEVVVERGAARSIRLADGRTFTSDAIICTSSLPETIHRLLSGRHGLRQHERKLNEWKMFEPIVLASFGLARSLHELPATMLVDGIPSIDTGGRRCDYLYLRIYDHDLTFAPPGHAIVQAMLPTDYAYWASRGSQYQDAKAQVAARILNAIDRVIPGVREAHRMTDLATPLTYWRMARSWRGAYEGWMQNKDTLFGHVDKRIEGLENFYLAGQWVEPGGGIPVAVMSGRQAVQLLCADLGKQFSPPPA